MGSEMCIRDRQRYQQAEHEADENEQRYLEEAQELLAQQEAVRLFSNRDQQNRMEIENLRQQLADVEKGHRAQGDRPVEAGPIPYGPMSPLWQAPDSFPKTSPFPTSTSVSQGNRFVRRLSNRMQRCRLISRPYFPNAIKREKSLNTSRETSTHTQGRDSRIDTYP